MREHVEPGATLYTDEARAYAGMPEYTHEAVNHSAKEFVDGMAHINGIESFWAMLKRGYQGAFHKFSEKHLDRYVAEFAGRHNVREADTEDQMAIVVRQAVGCRLRYRDLIADNGLPSGARARCSLPRKPACSSKFHPKMTSASGFMRKTAGRSCLPCPRTVFC